MTVTRKEAVRRKTASKVLRLALSYAQSMSWRECMKMAWANIKLVARMTAENVTFFFKKTDGTIRRAVGTLQSSVLPPTSGQHRDCPGVQVYFDVEKQSFRSFRKENLLSVE